MTSLLNRERPPVFCPGCTHERIVRGLDLALQGLGVDGKDVVLVSDIGCSGLFDVFFHTHAFHGLHGRALTYALGLKMARPELHVIVTMGDGGMGIGGAHFLSACRKNADITLLVLNNFNFGMTGGQYSSTTPAEALTSSGFLNTLEAPLDICRVAESAGAPFVLRCSGLEKDLVENMEKALAYKGFAVMDVWGICPGRYGRKNRMKPSEIRQAIGEMRPYTGVIPENERPEYVRGYFDAAARLEAVVPPSQVSVCHTPPQRKRAEILILGSAGQRIVTAGELLCLAALSGGMQATQKNDYDITVLRGPSVSEIILWPGEVGFAGIDCPDVVIVLSEDGVRRRPHIFGAMTEEGMVLHVDDVELPACAAKKVGLGLKGKNIDAPNWALAALALVAVENRIIDLKMLKTAIAERFSPKQQEKALETVEKALGKKGLLGDALSY